MISHNDSSIIVFCDNCKNSLIFFISLLFRFITELVVVLETAGPAGERGLKIAIPSFIINHLNLREGMKHG